MLVPSPAIAALLTLSGVDAVLTICRDLGAALAAARAASADGEPAPV